MKSLCDAQLAQPLLAFAFAFYVIAIIGGEIRRHNPAFKGALDTLQNNDSRQIKTNKYFRLISLGFITVIACFALYPHAYKLLIPIKPMKNHLYNLLGIVLLVVSMVRMVLVQLDADQEMHKSNQRNQAISHAALMHFSKKMTAVYFMIFLGFTLILANCATICLLLIAAILYKSQLQFHKG